MISFKKYFFLNLVACFALFSVAKSQHYQIPNYTPFNFGNPNYHSNDDPNIHYHVFKVIFLDSTDKKVIGTINSDSTVQFLKWEDMSVKKTDPARFKKIYPSQTLCILRVADRLPDYKGTPSDSCWLFKAIEGRITVYSVAAEIEVKIEYFFYIQKDNGPLLKMNIDTLETMLNDDEKALKLFNKKRYEDAIREYDSENK